MMGLITNGLGGDASSMIIMNYGFITVEIIPSPTPSTTPEPTPEPTPQPTPEPTSLPEPPKTLSSKSEPVFYDVIISVRPFKDKDPKRISFRMNEENVNKFVQFKVNIRKLRVRFSVIINKITEFVRK